MFCLQQKPEGNDRITKIIRTERINQLGLLRYQRISGAVFAAKGGRHPLTRIFIAFIQMGVWRRTSRYL